MKRTALVVGFVLAAVTMTTAGEPQLPAPSTEALGQALPTRAGYGGCTMPEEMQALFGSTPPPGTEIEPAPTRSRLCELEIPICWLGEYEPTCGDDYVDTFNSGCNDPAEAFSVLPESYGQPLVVLGQSGTFLVGGVESWRDTDWYEIVLDAPTEITFCCIAEFTLQIAIIDGTLGCAGYTIVDMITDFPECTEACITQTIGPGTFWLWVGPSVFTGIPCGSDYIMTVQGYVPDVCAIECPDGSIIDEEPVCGPGYDDYYNGGCNFDPATFVPLDPSGGMIVLCGETGVFEHPFGCSRDLDWFEITPAEPSEIEFCAAAEFDIIIWLISPGPDPMDPCFDSFAVDWDQAPACEAACIDAVLDPGRWWLAVSTVDWLPLDCGSEYTMTLTGYTTPVERVSWGSVKALYR